MNKFKKISAILLAFLVFISLYSCSGTNIEGKLSSVSITSTTIKLKAEFGHYEALDNGSATAFVKRVSDSDSTSSSYYKTVSQTAGSGTVEYTSLTAETEYTFELYIEYDSGNKQKLIDTATFKTTSSEKATIEVSSYEELIEIDQEIVEAEIVLTDDIDCGGNEVALFTSSSASDKFQGILDGNGHTIYNYSLKNATATGLFGYTDGALFKNLTIGSATGNIKYSTTGTNGTKSSADIGALVGNASNTKFNDVTVTNVIYGEKGSTSKFNGYGTSSSGMINVGGVVGNAINCTFTNVKVKDSSIYMTKAKLYVSIGLLAGSISGNAYAKDEYVVKNCSASGEIYANCEYKSYEGYTQIGGFVGTLSATGVVEDSYSNVEIAVTRTAGSDYVNHTLYVGGFVGKDHNANISIKNCLSLADITCYAGLVENYTESSDGLDETAIKTNVWYNLLATKAYVGGFAGRLSKSVTNIEGCIYVPRVNGIVICAKAKDSEEVKDEETKEEESTEGDSSKETTTIDVDYVWVTLFVGKSETSNISSSGYAKENKLTFGSVSDTTTNKIETYTNLTEEIQALINGTYTTYGTINAMTSSSSN